MHGHTEMCNLISSTQSLMSERTVRVEYEKRNSTSPSNHVLFCLLYEHLTNKKKLNSGFKKRTCYQSFMALNRASDMSAADWLSQTCMENYCNFSCVVKWFFSLVEVPLKHSSLCNEVVYPLQCAKKVMSDCPGLVDFAIGLVNSVLDSPDGQAKIFQRIKITKVL